MRCEVFPCDTSGYLECLGGRWGENQITPMEREIQAANFEGWEAILPIGVRKVTRFQTEEMESKIAEKSVQSKLRYTITSSTET